MPAGLTAPSLARSLVTPSEKSATQMFAPSNANRADKVREFYTQNVPRMRNGSTSESSNTEKGFGIMLNWAISFLVIALIAAVLGFGVLAGTAMEIAKLLFFVFIVLFLVSFLVGRRSPPV